MRGLLWTLLLFGSFGWAGAQEPELPPAPDAVDPRDLPEPEPSPIGANELREGFEGERPLWRQEASDATILVQAHDLSDEVLHDGKRSEHLKFRAGPGSHLYISYALPKVPLTDDLRARVYVRANREGVRILGRVVLPKDIDPATGQPSFITVMGGESQAIDRWRPLELGDLPAAVERQARVLRASSRRPVSLEGAYLERILLNVYTGPGDTEVYLDDLSVSPVPPDALAVRPDAEAAPDRDAPAGEEGDEAVGSGSVQFRRNRLSRFDTRDQKFYPWVPTIIDAPGADLEALRRFGFDVLAVDADAPADRLERAAEMGFLLMPRLAHRDASSLSRAGAIEAIRQFPAEASVAFWHLGSGWGGESVAEARRDRVSEIRELVGELRDLPGGVSRLTTADVEGSFSLFSKRPGRLDMIGVAPHAWGGSTHPLDLMRYLQQRRDLTSLDNPQGLFWAWVPVVPPPAFDRAVWGNDPPPAGRRTMVQPEQLRLMTMAALAAGYRGVGFTADASLTEEAGRANLIELSFLNAEIDLFETAIGLANDPIRIYNTHPAPPPKVVLPMSATNVLKPSRDAEVAAHQSIKAVAFETPDKRGTLILLADFPSGAQWQPPQMAVDRLRVRVPGHQSATAWQVSLGEVKYIDRERVPGGIELTIEDFGVSALVLLTTDLSLKERIAADVARLRPIAADLAIQQADEHVRSVLEVHSRLVERGHDVKGSAELMQLARDTAASARAALERGDHAAAWAEARRVGRPLRILMRNHFDKAVGELSSATRFPDDTSPVIVPPTGSPPLVSMSTLPQHFVWVDWVKRYGFGRNLIEGGNFEETDSDSFRSAGWEVRNYEDEDLVGQIANVADDDPARQGVSRRALRLRAQPRDPAQLDRLPPYQDQPIVSVVSPPAPVGRHQFLRISVLVKMPRPATPGAGGLFVRDSLGGQELEFRTTEALPRWTRIVLYRRAPEDGEVKVQFGLASTSGEVYFDDLRIERAEEPGYASTPTTEAPSRPDAEAVEPAPDLPEATVPTASLPASATPRR